ncbi:MAG TPA: phosphatase PAP2 family protein [Steroidobacteraceae bacterium]|nr:phosphatase PAP2 family protein [Steroidobacteraceae bacterium]
MVFASSAELIRRADAAEERLCVAFNRCSDRAAVRVFFAAISRLGNGVFWYVLIFALPLLFGAPAFVRTLQLSVTGVIGVLLYKWLKQRFVRERPYISHLRIRAGTPPLDRYSFPSGHTLHAVSFAIMLAAYFPILAWIVVPFAALVAVSRVILGLHYPTDVAVGALIGTTLAMTSMSLVA